MSTNTSTDLTNHTIITVNFGIEFGIIMLLMQQSDTLANWPLEAKVLSTLLVIELKATLVEGVRMEFSVRL